MSPIVSPAAPVRGRVQAVPDVLNVLDAALWLVLVGAYLAQGPRIVLADLRDPVLSPFVPASALTAMLLAAALANVAFAVGRVLVVVFLVQAFLLGCPHETAVLDQRGSAVVVERRDPEHAHGTAGSLRTACR